MGVVYLEDGTAVEQKAMRRAMSSLWPHVARGWNPDLYEAIEEYSAELQRMEAVLLEAKPVRVRFGLPTIITREGTVAVMATNIPTDRALRVPLVFLNAAGSAVQGAVGGSVSVSDGTAAAVSTDDQSVLISPMGAEGTSFMVSYSSADGAMTTGEVEFTIGAAVDGGGVVTPPGGDPNAPVSVSMNVMGATLEPKSGTATPVEPTPVTPPTDGSLPAAPEATPA